MKEKIWTTGPWNIFFTDKKIKAILVPVIYRCIGTSMRIPRAIFTKLVKKEKCEIHIESQNTCPQTILNKNKAENISLPNFLIHYKTTAFRAICYWYRKKLICVIEQTTRTTSIDLWANGCWKTKWPHVEEWNWTLTLLHPGKSTQNRLEN